MYKFIVFTIGVILFSCSTPPNNPIDQEATIISTSGRRAQTVYLTKNNSGQPVIAWTEEDTTSKEEYFFYAISADSGNTFSNKVKVPIEPKTKLHAEGMPKIAFRKNGDAYAFYEVKTNSEINRFASEIHYKVSKNNGATWSAAMRVHQNSAPHKGWSFIDVTLLNNGELGVCWLDTSNSGGGRPVKFAQTDSNGKFTAEVIVDSLACECCRTAIFSDKSGNISIVYRDIINDSIRDISVSVSTDNGKTFSKPVCFSGDNWNINGCPHNGPDVVSDNKNIYATWFTGANEKGVYYGEVRFDGKVIKKERITPEGRNIQIALLPNGNKVIIFNEQAQNGSEYYSAIKLKVVGSEKTIELTEKNTKASLPALHVFGGNNCLCSWIGDMAGGRFVFYKRIKSVY